MKHSKWLYDFKISLFEIQIIYNAEKKGTKLLHLTSKEQNPKHVYLESHSELSSGIYSQETDQT